MVGDEGFSTREVDVGFREANRLVLVSQSRQGLVEYGLRSYVPMRSAERQPGTCASSIAKFVMRPGTVFEVRERTGVPLTERYGVVNADATDIVRINEEEALDILDPAGAIRRRFHLAILRSRIANRETRYTFTGTDWLTVGEPFDWDGILCVGSRKTARQAWIRPCTLREVHPGVPAYPGTPPENPLDHLPERLRPASALAA